MTNPNMEDLAREIYRINVDNGWDVTIPEDWGSEHDKLGAKMALIHSEVSEALEAIREGDRDNFEEELADVIIRVLDVAYGLGVNISTRIHDKIEINKSRGYRHGGKMI